MKVWIFRDLEHMPSNRHFRLSLPFRKSRGKSGKPESFLKSHWFPDQVRNDGMRHY
jgi:hypothetical protein